MHQYHIVSFNSGESGKRRTFKQQAVEQNNSNSNVETHDLIQFTYINL